MCSSRTILCSVLFSGIPLLVAGSPGGGPRGPADLALDPSGRWLFTANQASGSVSVLDVRSGEVLDELTLHPGGGPRRVALVALPGGEFALAASESLVHRVAIIRATARPRSPPAAGRRPRPLLRLARAVETGRLPEGLAFTEDGRRLLVACAGEGEVWELDALSGAVCRRLTAVEGVRHVRALGPGAAGGRKLAAVAGRTEAGVIDLESGRLLGARALAGGKALNLEGIVLAAGYLWIPHQIVPLEVTTEPQMIVWGLIIANRVTGIPLASFLEPTGAPEGRECVLPLDERHRANGDPAAPALLEGPQGPARLLVPSAGTDRLLVLDLDATGRSGNESLAAVEAVPSIATGDRPLAVATDPARDLAYVVSSLDDAVDVVDLRARKVSRVLRLGPPPEPTPEHLGARIFFDSTRSRGGWYSCHSCHPEGGTRGHRFDTQADGDGMAKRSPDLRGTAATAPWGWIGRFEALEEQVASSLHRTMAVDAPPAGEDVARVVAFLRTLERPLPLRHGETLGGDRERGEHAFRKAGCGRCHRPPAYTSPGLEDAGVSDEYDGRSRFNPPSLLGVRDRYRYLHDGRARSLREVFREHNARELHGDAHTLSEAELEDLLAFLEGL